jgi:hypothetical protein
MVAGVATVCRPPGQAVPWLARVFLVCGIVGSVGFTATWLVEGMMRPGYDAWVQPISALSLGSGGWVQRANFVVFGALVGCSAIGWHLVLRPGVGAIAVPVLKMVTAGALFVDGVFSQDAANGFPPGAVAPAVSTFHGDLHLAGAVVAIVALSATCFVFAWRFGMEPDWHRWSAAAIAAGVLTVAFMAAFGASGDGAPAGVFERLATEMEGAYMVCLVVCLLTNAKQVAVRGRVQTEGRHTTEVRDREVMALPEEGP